MPPSLAAFALAEHTLNRSAFGIRAVSILSEVVRGAEDIAGEAEPQRQRVLLPGGIVPGAGLWIQVWFPWPAAHGGGPGTTRA